MFQKYDFVKIVSVEDRYKDFLEQEGMIIDIDMNYELPYELCFFDKVIQTINMNEGNLLWRSEELEVIE